MDAHRMLLLALSDGMSSDDVQRLMFICPAVVFSEDIKRGYQLFIKLERMGLLGPGNYSYLSERLKQIGRIDLDNMLPIQGSTICYVPTSFQSPWNTLETVFTARQSKMIYFKNLVFKIVNNSQRWHSSVSQVSQWLGKIQHFAERGAELQAVDVAKPQFQDAMINALMFTEEYVTRNVVYMASFKRPDPSAIKSSAERMIAYQDAFLKVMGVQVITQISVHFPIHDLAHLANQACEYIESICTGIVDSMMVMTEVKQTKEKFMYFFGDKSLMFAWLLSCAYLAASSQIDLKPYHSYLVSLANKHKPMISKYYSSIAAILGQEVLHRALVEVDTEVSEILNRRNDFCEMLLVGWLSVVLLYLALSNVDKEAKQIDVSIIVARVTELIQQDKLIEFAARHNDKVHLEIENLKGRLVQLCPPFSPQQDLMKRLLVTDF